MHIASLDGSDTAFLSEVRLSGATSWAMSSDRVLALSADTGGTSVLVVLTANGAALSNVAITFDLDGVDARPPRWSPQNPPLTAIEPPAAAWDSPVLPILKRVLDSIDLRLGCLGGGWGPVALPVFKTVWVSVIPALVGSTPMRPRHLKMPDFRHEWREGELKLPFESFRAFVD